MNRLNLEERFYFQDLGMVSPKLQGIQKPSELPGSVILNYGRHTGYSKNYDG